MPGITHDAMAVLLLTAHLAGAPENHLRPLGAMEWSRLVLWLDERNAKPADLLVPDPSELLRGWDDPKCPLERLAGLLNRGVLAGIALEKWERAGLWIVIQSDGDYPRKVKERLMDGAPPLFFGCGNRQLLNAAGVAVVGSRNASPGDLAFSADCGKRTAFEGKALISGGARGVDEAAMAGALAVEGTVVGVLADGLLRASVSQKYRMALQKKNLVLISPYYPEAPFHVGNAMARNKYIYCLADSAVVVHSGRDGGTWNGAMENLKKRWIPLWVKQTDDARAGNAELVKFGARWLPENGDAKPSENAGKNLESPLSVSIPETGNPVFSALVMDDQTSYGKSAEDVVKPVSGEKTEETPLRSGDTESYELFCGKLSGLLAKGMLPLTEIESSFSLVTEQLNAWLRRAVADGLITRKTRPLRYELARSKRQQEQGALFE
jgi:predicted Rossmann fold nucleotide-binding protein DprA/Smf involved in DNA uptake